MSWLDDYPDGDLVEEEPFFDSFGERRFEPPQFRDDDEEQPRPSSWRYWLLRGCCALVAVLLAVLAVLWVKNPHIGMSLKPSPAPAPGCVFKLAVQGGSSSCNSGERYSVGHSCPLKLPARTCEASVCALSGVFSPAAPKCVAGAPGANKEMAALDKALQGTDRGTVKDQQRNVEQALEQLNPVDPGVDATITALRAANRLMAEKLGADNMRDAWEVTMKQIDPRVRLMLEDGLVLIGGSETRRIYVLLVSWLEQLELRKYGEMQRLSKDGEGAGLVPPNQRALVNKLPGLHVPGDGDLRFEYTVGQIRLFYLWKSDLSPHYPDLLPAYVAKCSRATLYLGSPLSHLLYNPAFPTSTCNLLERAQLHLKQDLGAKTARAKREYAVLMKAGMAKGESKQRLAAALQAEYEEQQTVPKSFAEKEQRAVRDAERELGQELTRAVAGLIFKTKVLPEAVVLGTGSAYCDVMQQDAMLRIESSGDLLRYRHTTAAPHPSSCACGAKMVRGHSNVSVCDEFLQSNTGMLNANHVVLAVAENVKTKLADMYSAAKGFTNRMVKYSKDDCHLTDWPYFVIAAQVNSIYRSLSSDELPELEQRFNPTTAPTQSPTFPTVRFVGPSPINPFAERSKRQTVVLMADTRELPPEPPGSWEEASWEQIAAVCNMIYAIKHDYKFVHWHMEQSGSSRKDGFGNSQEGCTHPSYGVRHPSWCKLLAIYKTLFDQDSHDLADGDDPLVMFVDSDMVFNQPTVGIESYLNRSGVCRTHPMPDPRLVKEGFPVQAQPRRHCGAQCVEAFQLATVLVNMDPNGDFGNCGMQMWRSRDVDAAMELLGDWWNLNSPEHNIGFPWEQFAFNHWLWPQHKKQVRIIQDTPPQFSNPMFTDKDGFLTHVVGFRDITHPGTRKKLLQQTAEQVYQLDIGEFGRLYSTLVAKHHVQLSKAEMLQLSRDLASAHQRT